MARNITERHGAKPYAFMFSTRERKDDELDSKVVNNSGMYYLGGTIYTRQEVEDRNLPGEEILRFNMKANGIDKIIVITNGFKSTQPFGKEDVRLDF